MEVLVGEPALAFPGGAGRDRHGGNLQAGKSFAMVHHQGTLAQKVV
jgi:hypothetical protein